MAVEDAIAVVRAYHERTKHRPDRAARAPGHMEWATQPDLFRRYTDTDRVVMELYPADNSPSYDALFEAEPIQPAACNLALISRLFQDSLALSAWQQAGDSRWSLRINPSSGDLHPTEAYVITGPVEGLCETPAAFHYCAFDHALELRTHLPQPLWQHVSEALPKGSFFVALSSIYWRESWKYGERAFRYCHQDGGHALAAIALSAAADGYAARLVVGIADSDVARLCGMDQQHGIEAEHPLVLVAMLPGAEAKGGLRMVFEPLTQLDTATLVGVPNRLSNGRRAWPVVDAVAQATAYGGSGRIELAGPACSVAVDLPRSRSQGARTLFRQRRSAVAMDGGTAISCETFWSLLARLMPDARSPVFGIWPWPPAVSLALFVHRVEGLEPGLYLLARTPEHAASLREQCDPRLMWTRLEGCPVSLPFYGLTKGDVRYAARTINCQQDIASDGAFSVSMLAWMTPALQRHGAWFYPRLFWETGMMGQLLYLEAEAAGVRGTGIGGYFDDLMHRILGLASQGDWQSLYHFTVGGAIDDPRIQTLDPYFHR